MALHEADKARMHGLFDHFLMPKSCSKRRLMTAELIFLNRRRCINRIQRGLRTRTGPQRADLGGRKGDVDDYLIFLIETVWMQGGLFLRNLTTEFENNLACILDLDYHEEAVTAIECAYALSSCAT